MKKAIDKTKETKWLWIIFIIYLVFNLFLVLMHEPWRDEIHAWLMAKDYNFLELIRESRFDGHPVLWHLILMPFAKLGFPIITLNIISLVVVSLSVYLFLFKTKLPLFLKIIAAFTIPFTYTYTAIARNYSLIILLLIAIGVMYDKRYEKPIVYSVLISLLIHTHALAWGIVAGLTITFHFSEIINYFRKKNKSDIRKVLLGLCLIIVNTVLVVLELYGNNNPNYGVGYSNFVSRCLIIMYVIIFITFIITIVTNRHIKEFIVLFMGFLFQIIIYKFVYSSILYQRFILIFVFVLFYAILISKVNSKKDYLMKYSIMCFIILTLGFAIFVTNVFDDINKPYSGAEEMAEYINNNIKDTDTVYIDASVIGQTMIPYLDSVKLYDIVYDEYAIACNVPYEYEKIIYKLQNIDESYMGKYLIVSNNIITLPYEKVYETKDAIINEDFTLYYINQ